MKTIKLIDNQVEVLAESLIYMGTEWGNCVRGLNHNPDDSQFDYWTDESKKEVRKNYRVAKNILHKIGYSKDNI